MFGKAFGNAGRGFLRANSSSGNRVVANHSHLASNHISLGGVIEKIEKGKKDAEDKVVEDTYKKELDAYEKKPGIIKAFSSKPTPPPNLAKAKELTPPKEEKKSKKTDKPAVDALIADAKEAVQKKVPKEAIKKKLKESGYSQADIDKVMKAL